MQTNNLSSDRGLDSQPDFTETLCLSNARLVLKDNVIHGCIVVSDGVITGIGGGTGVPDGAIDCAGDYLIPGLDELHMDNLERHLEPRLEVDWPHLSAILAHDAELASTGITTVFDALRVCSFDKGKGKGKGSYVGYAECVAHGKLGTYESEDASKK